MFIQFAKTQRDDDDDDDDDDEVHDVEDNQPFYPAARASEVQV